MEFEGRIWSTIVKEAWRDPKVFSMVWVLIYSTLRKPWVTPDFPSAFYAAWVIPAEEKGRLKKNRFGRKGKVYILGGGDCKIGRPKR